MPLLNILFEKLAAYQKDLTAVAEEDAK